MGWPRLADRVSMRRPAHKDAAHRLDHPLNSALPSPPATTHPSPMACTGRRMLAKLVDIALFGTLSLVVGRLLIPEQVSMGGLVPAFGTTLWALGFFVAADTICARLLGASPGEFLAGVRVVAVDGSPLTWSARQDRTTDALVDGTIGAIGLLRALVKGKPAAYDRDWRVVFLSLSGAQRVVVGLLTVASLCLLLALGLWLSAVKAADADARVAVSKVLRHIGLPVHAVWANPATGIPVELPAGWYVRKQIQRVNTGDVVVEFRCEWPGEAPCRIQMALSSWHEAGFLDATRETSGEAIEKAFNAMLDEPDAMVVDDRPALQGADRLDHIYSVQLAPVEDSPNQKPRAGLAWFTERKNSWTLGINVPPRDGGTALSVDEEAFVLALVQSAFGARDR